MNRALNLIFHGLHLFIILFCFLGWLYEPFRALHLLLLLAIAFSWFGLGYFFGFGYCLITDLHWKLKTAMGQPPETDSYVKYMVDKVLRLDSNPVLVDRITTALFFMALVVSTLLNFRPL